MSSESIAMAREIASGITEETKSTHIMLALVRQEHETLAEYQQRVYIAALEAIHGGY